VVAGVKLMCDPCGSANQHAQELVQMVQELKNKTRADKVNIVGHSKGGLDARVYLGNNLSNTLYHPVHHSLGERLWYVLNSKKPNVTKFLSSKDDDFL
jgi:triacylglycerol esterase/lipase EstA (alpha/beta hydrolase family)